MDHGEQLAAIAVQLENQGEMLSRILDQATRTNGRVTALEIRAERDESAARGGRRLAAVMWAALWLGLGGVGSLALAHVMGDQVTRADQVQREQTRGGGGAIDWRDYTPMRERR